MNLAMLNQQIADAEEQLKNLRAQKKEREGLDPVQYLATVLHARLCNWNHTDGCGWHYHVKNGKHDWTEYTHKQYLERAQRVHDYCKRQEISESDALALLSLMTDK